MEDYTIVEEYTLPSLGKVYKSQVNPNIKLRSMTTEDEMRKLNPSDYSYKPLCDLIERCLVEKPGIPVYDLCIQDFTFLLHKLRILTFGSEYRIKYTCPLCGTTEDKKLDMNSLPIIQFDTEMEKLFTITLPRSQKTIELRLLTPRLSDEIDSKLKEDLRRNGKTEENKVILYTLQATVSKISGQVVDDFISEQFFRKLPAMDRNYIEKSIQKINFGIDTNLQMECSACGYENNLPFPITSEFFGPSID